MPTLKLKLPFKLPYRIIEIASDPKVIVAIAGIAAAGAVSYQLYSQTFMAAAANVPIITKSNPTKVYLSSAAAGADASAASNAQTIEMNIANNGLALVRNAKVISVSPGTLVVQIAWGREGFNWTVHTNYNTRFIEQTGQEGTLGDIQQGDLVTITGQLDTNAGEPTITAQFVRY